MNSLIERREKDIVGVLSCYDRVIVHGTLPGFNYSQGMTSYLRARGIRIFDYTKFAEPLREQLRRNAEKLDKITQPKRDTGRTYQGFNFFSSQDRDVLLAVMRGEHVITGFRQRDLRSHLPHLTSSQLSRHVKRLRVHGLIKRVGHHYKYYVTALGRRAVLTGLKLRELVRIPSFASAPAS